MAIYFFSVAWTVLKILSIQLDGGEKIQKVFGIMIIPWRLFNFQQTQSTMILSEKENSCRPDIMPILKILHGYIFMVINVMVYVKCDIQSKYSKWSYKTLEYLILSGCLTVIYNGHPPSSNYIDIWNMKFLWSH